MERRALTTEADRRHARVAELNSGLGPASGCVCASHVGTLGMRTQPPVVAGLMDSLIFNRSTVVQTLACGGVSRCRPGVCCCL